MLCGAGWGQPSSAQARCLDEPGTECSLCSRQRLHQPSQLICCSCSAILARQMAEAGPMQEFDAWFKLAASCGMQVGPCASSRAPLNAPEAVHHCRPTQHVWGGTAAAAHSCCWSRCMCTAACFLLTCWAPSCAGAERHELGHSNGRWAAVCALVSCGWNDSTLW